MKRRAFTLIELLVVIAIISLLVSILLPTLSKARRLAKQMANSAQLRGVHSGMVLHAQENGGMLPGAASEVEYVAGDLDENSTTLAWAACRTMIKKQLAPSNMFFSPGEHQSSKRRYRDVPGSDETDPGNTSSPNNPVFWRDHMSYGLLLGGNGPPSAIDDDRYFYDQIRKKLSAGTSNPLPGSSYTTADQDLGPIFAKAWQESSGPNTPIIADRIAFGAGAISSGLGQSIWAPTGGRWEGSVAWGDGHVAYETEQANIPWEVDRYTGMGLIPPDQDNTVTLPYSATVLLWQ